METLSQYLPNNRMGLDSSTPLTALLSECTVRLHWPQEDAIVPCVPCLLHASKIAACHISMAIEMAQARPHAII